MTKKRARHKTDSASDNEQQETIEDESRPLNSGMGLAYGAGLGVAFGSAFGAVFGDVAMGISFGIVFGAAIGLVFGPLIVKLFELDSENDSE